MSALARAAPTSLVARSHQLEPAGLHRRQQRSNLAMVPLPALAVPVDAVHRRLLRALSQQLPHDGRRRLRVRTTRFYSTPKLHALQQRSGRQWALGDSSYKALGSLKIPHLFTGSDFVLIAAPVVQVSLACKCRTGRGMANLVGTGGQGLPLRRLDRGRRRDDVAVDRTHHLAQHGQGDCETPASPAGATVNKVCRATLPSATISLLSSMYLSGAPHIEAALCGYISCLCSCVDVSAAHACADAPSTCLSGSLPGLTDTCACVLRLEKKSFR